MSGRNRTPRRCVYIYLPTFASRCSLTFLASPVGLAAEAGGETRGVEGEGGEGEGKCEVERESQGWCREVLRIVAGVSTMPQRYRAAVHVLRVQHELIDCGRQRSPLHRLGLTLRCPTLSITVQWHCMRRHGLVPGECTSSFESKSFRSQHIFITSTIVDLLAAIRPMTGAWQ